METPWRSFLEIVSDSVVRMRDIGVRDIPFETLAQWAGEACRNFARRSGLVRQEYRRPLIPGQRFYRLPSDCHRVSKLSVHYPGNRAPRELPFMDQYHLLDSNTVAQEGEPQQWYLNGAKDEYGLYLIPNRGGLIGATSGAGNVGGTTVALPATASDEDDYYNDMELRLLDGARQGEEQTISDYNGTTKVATVDTAFSGQVASGVRISIGTGQTIVEFQANGNSYNRMDIENATVLASPAPDYNLVAFTVTQKPTNFWKGWEVYFRTGSAKYEKSRVVASEIVTGSAGDTMLTLWPELPVKPATGNGISLRQVPNIPDSFHQALVDYVCASALKVLNNNNADKYFASYESQLEEAMRVDDPDQDQEFEGIREYSRGEEEDEWG